MGISGIMTGFCIRFVVNLLKVYEPRTNRAITQCLRWGALAAVSIKARCGGGH